MMPKALSDYEKAEIRNRAKAEVEFWTNDGDRITALPWTRGQLTPREFQEWVGSRKDAGREVDPLTCEIERWYAYDCDPYGADPDLPEEWQVIARNRFVRSPWSRGWVHEYDLPEATRRALWDRIERERAR